MLRPRPAQRIRVLCARDDLLGLLAVLAATRGVEVEGSGTCGWRDAGRVHAALAEAEALAERYAVHWPAPDASLPHAAAIGELAEAAVAALRRWEGAAAASVAALAACEQQLHACVLQREWESALQAAGLDYTDLPEEGAPVSAHVYLLPDGAELTAPDAALRLSIRSATDSFLLIVGSSAVLAETARRVALVEGRRFRPDRLTEMQEGGRERHLQELRGKRAALRDALAKIAQAEKLPAHLGVLAWLRWALANGDGQPGSAAFAWVEGWAERRTAGRLAETLHEAGMHALASALQAPAGRSAPVVLDNPRWAVPFEALTRLYGTPAPGEPDPSGLLAIIAPLLFGYMFGDLGQGLVIAALGLLIGRRYSAARMLVPCGVSAAAFGLLFGSVFGVEGIVPALWLHPISAPELILLPPLLFGAGLLLLGTGLGALAAWWHRQLLVWLREEGGLALAYMALLGVLLPPLGKVFAFAWLTWFAWWSAGIIGRDGWWRLPGAWFELVERAMRLLLNTLSFARVGAFALAHAGLSLATVQLATAAGGGVAGLVVLLLGNLIVLGLEGLVVSIQTTRLLLFEFFLRFLRGDGRALRPLLLPRVT